MMPQLIEHICHDEQDILLVEYRQGNYTLVFHPDPGLDFAVRPDGSRVPTYCADGGSPVDLPQELWAHVMGYFDLITA